MPAQPFHGYSNNLKGKSSFQASGNNAIHAAAQASATFHGSFNGQQHADDPTLMAKTGVTFPHNNKRPVNGQS